MRKKVLFICTHNAIRSHMAEAFLRNLKGDRYDAYSAGTDPTMVDPTAIKVMEEMGIDMSGHRSKSLDEYYGRDLDLVITICNSAKEACPFFPGGKEQDHRSFRDPPELVEEGMEPLDAFRVIRDEIREWVINAF